MGRRKGEGPFVGGRRKGSMNKKGSFQAKLPPIRCSILLLKFAEKEAKESGCSTMSAWIRDVFELFMSYKKEAKATGKPMLVWMRDVFEDNKNEGA